MLPVNSALLRLPEHLFRSDPDSPNIEQFAVEVEFQSGDKAVINAGHLLPIAARMLANEQISAPAIYANQLVPAILDEPGLLSEIALQVPECDYHQLLDAAAANAH